MHVVVGLHNYEYPQLIGHGVHSARTRIFQISCKSGV